MQGGSEWERCMFSNNFRGPFQRNSVSSTAWWIVLGIVVLFVAPSALCSLFQTSTLNAMFGGAALVGIAWGLTAWRHWNQKQTLARQWQAYEMQRSQLIQWEQDTRQALDAEKRRLVERERTYRGELEEAFRGKQRESAKLYEARLSALRERELGVAEQERAIEQWKRAMHTRTLDELRTLSPKDFELAMGELLRRLGFQNVRHVGGSGDQGVDLTCEAPDGDSVVVQCKRYAEDNSVGSPDIQRFLGSIVHSHAHRGLFITT